MQTDSKDLPLQGYTNFSLRFEYTSSLLIVHLPTCNLTKSAYKELKALADSWCSFAKTIGFQGIHAAVPVEDKTTYKLAVSLGFRYLTTNDGYHIYLYDKE